MRIAQVAPLIESVPPKFYGGTERVVSYLTEELVQQGHEVTLFASGDSVTSARLQAVCGRALRLDPSCRDALPYHMLLIERVLRQGSDFDVIHFHIDMLQYSVFSRYCTPSVTTLHGRLDIPDLLPLFREFQDVPVVSISDEQRRPMPWLNWQDTVYHGLPQDMLRFSPKSSGYLAFIGRICPEKGPDVAIQIAKEVGLPLKVAAKIDEADREYFAEVVRPLFKDPLVEYVGEITEGEKSEFLGGAVAVLLPIVWPEPFGLTMIEAMACGTPTVAFKAGSVPEVIDNGVTGLIVANLDEAIGAVERVAALDRFAVRERFDQRFTANRMARDYLRIYERIIAGQIVTQRVA